MTITQPTTTITRRTELLDRVAAAPISWGVCEMPGWGYQLPAEHVLSDMAEFGFTHTELGSLGYLPTEPAELRSTLMEHGLSLLGGFVPLVLHEPTHHDHTRAAALRWAELISAAGGSFFITCAISHPADWRQTPLRGSQWSHVCSFLAELDDLTRSYDLVQVLHPHVGSLVETDAETSMILSHSDTSIVLDTAHLMLGGSNLLQLVDLHADRIGLVHLKDVNLSVASRLQTAEITYMQAVQSGLFPPLGQGGVPIERIISRLEQPGRELWYVLEQDAALSDGDARAITRLRQNVTESLGFLRSLVSARAAGATNHNNQLQEGRIK